MENGFRGYHPYVQFCYYICVGILGMYFNHPIFLITGLLLLVFVNMTHDGGKALRKMIPLLVIMSSLMIILNPFLVSRGTAILFYFRGKQVTLEALVYGITMAMFITIIFLMFVSFNLILNGNRFLYIFSKILPRSALLVMISIRFVPLLRRRLQEINMVQRLRGRSITAGTVQQRARNGMLQIQILLTWSLEEAVQTADSMKARGFGLGKKTSYLHYQMEKRDRCWFLVLILLLIICILGGTLGYGKIIIYPELGTFQLFPIDWILLLCMMIIFAFPLIEEGREKLKWK